MEKFQAYALNIGGIDQKRAADVRASFSGRRPSTSWVVAPTVRWMLHFQWLGSRQLAVGSGQQASKLVPPFTARRILCGAFKVGCRRTT